MRLRTSIQALLLVIIPVFAFFPVSIGKHPLVYDIITTALPWRSYIADCLQHGILPLWNPYQNLGYPIHADPQSGAWYLPVWIIGSLYGYDFYSLSFEWLFHIVMAGFGMRWLGLRLKMSPATATLMGICYSCSGFFVGNAQHLPFVISGCWIPFCIAGFLWLSDERSWKAALILSLVLWLVITGGYPGFTIILAYLLVVLLLCKTIAIIRNDGARPLAGYYFLLLVATMIGTVLSLPYLLSFYQSLPFITRGDGTGILQALVCPFSPPSLISFVFPMAVVGDAQRFQTDPSMTNIYFGYLPLILMIGSLFREDAAMKWIFFGFGLFSLLAALGDFLPVRAFLYHHLPLMNYFRMPAIFRVFTILGFLVAMGYSLEYWRKSEISSGKSVRIILILSAMTMLALGIFVVFRRPEIIPETLRMISGEAGTPSPLVIRLFANIMALMILSLLGIMLLLTFRKKLHPLMVLLMITALDLVIMANANGPFTVYSSRTTVKELNQRLIQRPRDFPPPEDRPVCYNRDAFQSYKDLWVNLNCFYKKIGYEGYNPFSLKEFEDLAFYRKEVFDSLIQKPPFFLKQQERIKPRIIAFSPDCWKMEVTSGVTDTLCLLQNNYSGWSVRINGAKERLWVLEDVFMSVKIPKGTTEVIFRYRPESVIWVFCVSAVCLGCLLLNLVMLVIWPGRRWLKRPGPGRQG